MGGIHPSRGRGGSTDAVCDMSTSPRVQPTLLSLYWEKYVTEIFIVFQFGIKQSFLCFVWSILIRYNEIGSYLCNNLQHLLSLIGILRGSP